MKIYCDKTRGNIINQNAREYPEDALANEKEYCKIGKFCFSSILSEFNFQLTSKQIEQLFSILTLEQLEIINQKLITNPNG